MIATEMKPMIATDGTCPEEGLRVLFVCTGNTCRSPMAAALLNHFARPREVCSVGCEAAPRRFIATSAGLYANEGAPITPTAAEALSEFGIPALPGNDYTAHRARGVTEELLSAADIVVGISAAHAMELMMRYPDQASKITTFETDIPDPFGGTAEVYRACLLQLSHCVKRLFFSEEGAQ